MDPGLDRVRAGRRAGHCWLFWERQESGPPSTQHQASGNPDPRGQEQAEATLVEHLL